MALTQFTSYADIRASLGVAPEELEDETLALDLYAFTLSADLGDVEVDLGLNEGTLAEEYLGLGAPAKLEGADKALYESMRMFSTYSVALRLTTSLPLFSPKDISDGKATMGRYASNPYKDVIEGCKKAYDQARKRLISAYGNYSSSSTTEATPRTYFKVSSPSFDPITG